MNMDLISTVPGGTVQTKIFSTKRNLIQIQICFATLVGTFVCLARVQCLVQCLVQWRGPSLPCQTDGLEIQFSIQIVSVTSMAFRLGPLNRLKDGPSSSFKSIRAQPFYKLRTFFLVNQLIIRIKRGNTARESVLQGKIRVWLKRTSIPVFSEI